MKYLFGIFTLILVSLIWTSVHQMNAFAETDLSQLKLEPKESIFLKSSASAEQGMFRITLTATNTGTDEFYVPTNVYMENENNEVKVFSVFVAAAKSQSNTPNKLLIF